MPIASPAQQTPSLLQAVLIHLRVSVLRDFTVSFRVCGCEGMCGCRLCVPVLGLFSFAVFNIKDVRRRRRDWLLQLRAERHFRNRQNTDAIAVLLHAQLLRRAHRRTRCYVHQDEAGQRVSSQLITDDRNRNGCGRIRPESVASHCRASQYVTQ